MVDRFWTGQDGEILVTLDTFAAGSVFDDGTFAAHSRAEPKKKAASPRGRQPSFGDTQGYFRSREAMKSSTSFSAWSFS